MHDDLLVIVAVVTWAGVSQALALSLPVSLLLLALTLIGLVRLWGRDSA